MRLNGKMGEIVLFNVGIKAWLLKVRLHWRLQFILSLSMERK